MKVRVIAAALAAAVLMASLAGCGKKEETVSGPHLEQVGEQTFYSGQSFQNGYALVSTGEEFGYLSADGVYTPAFSAKGGDNLETFRNGFAEGASYEVSEEGLFPVYDSEKDAWGYGDIQSGETVIQPRFEKAMPFREGRAVCVEDGVPTVIDPDGNTILTAKRIYTGWYQKGLLLVSDGEEAFPSQVSGSEEEVEAWVCRLVDKDGETVMGDLLAGEGEENLYGYADPLYVRLDYPDENVIGVMGVADPTLKPGYYTPQGELIRELEEGKQAYPVGDGVTWFVDPESGLYGLETVEGEARTEALYQRVSTPSNGLAYCVDEDGRGGFLTVSTGQPAGEFAYDKAFPFSHGYAVAVKDGKAGLVGGDGREFTEFVYDNLAMIDDGLLYLEKEGTALISTVDGVEVENVTGRGVTYASEGIFALFSPIPEGEDGATRDNQMTYVRFVEE